MADDAGSDEQPRTLAELDWDEVKRLAEWWFRPIVERETWAAAGYVFAGLWVGIFGFVATVVLVSVSLSLIPALGLGLVVAFGAFGVIDAMADAERRRAGWVGVTIDPRPLRQPEGRLDWLWVRLADGARWRAVAYFALGVVFWPTVFGLVYGLWWIGVQGVFTLFEVNVLTFVLQAAAAVGLLGLAPRATVFAAEKCTEVVAFFLGDDKTAALQRRVATVEHQRDDVLDAVASERRRIERNLHDGVQQQLVALGIDLGMAANKLDDDPEAAKQLLDEARDKARASIGELRTIGRGLHPAILEDRGLDAALSAIVANSAIPITVDVQPGLALPTDTAETAYFVASEAVSNILKHSGARVASIKIYDRSGILHMSIHDDGTGGASAATGTGLAGMAARVNAHDGRFDLYSPPGGPTTLTVELPHG